MRVLIDLDSGTLEVEDAGAKKTLPLSSAEAFDLASKAWLRAGWDTKYVYSFTWFGRPIIQLPDDLLRIQEVIYRLKPDVILETGIAHGGSLIFYATLCKAMNHGRVLGIDVEIRPHNRKAVESHELYPLITMFEGSSTDAGILEKVRAFVKPSETVLVLLDSNHSKDHVLAELRSYAEFVKPGGYLVATDGIMAHLQGAPRSKPDWHTNNPIAAIDAFVEENKDFVVEEPGFAFNEGVVENRVTYWPKAFLRRIR